MHAFIRTVRDPNTRVKIVQDRQDFDDDPVTFRFGEPGYVGWD